MTYRAKPVTQRDGSDLAASNCRMASIATGLDFHTKGKKTSSGAKMRRSQSDQSGGTDSGDARRAWLKYDEVLRVRDGNTFDAALADLKAGRLVHLDVWHATVGSQVCISGTGRYGHTMAVAPEYRGTNGGQYLVADPWCKPGAWHWVDVSKLRKAAEEWGRRVRVHTGGSNDPLRLAAAAKLLMGQYRPGFEDPAPNPAETGGPQGIMYTTTRALAPTPTPTTGGSMSIYFAPRTWEDKGVDLFLDPDFKTKVTTTSPGGKLESIGYLAKVDSDGYDNTKVAIRVSTSKLATGSSDNKKALLWARSSDLGSAQQGSNTGWHDSIWALLGDPNGRFPAPVPNCSAEVKAAIEKRDAEWNAWLLGGSPGS